MTVQGTAPEDGSYNKLAQVVSNGSSRSLDP